MKSDSPAVCTLLFTLLLTPACSSPTTAPDTTGADAPVASEEQAAESGSEDAASDQIDAAAPQAPGETKPEPGPGPMPEKFAAIHDLLKGATLGKEPGNMAFNNQPEPTIALRWFGRYGKEAQVRTFALRALGLYPTPENTAVLDEVARNKEEPIDVRAGALRGLGRYDLEQPAMSKIREFIFATAENKDLVLAAAAIDAMHGMPTARPLLLELTTNPATPPALKAAAERALGPQVE